MLTSSIGLTGLAAYSKQMVASAENIANIQSNDYTPVGTRLETAATGGVSASFVEVRDLGRMLGQDLPFGDGLERDVVGLSRASFAYQANLALLRSDERTVGSLVDQFA